MIKPALKGLIVAFVCSFILAGAALAFNPPIVATDENGQTGFMVYNQSIGQYEGFMVKGMAYKPEPIGEYSIPAQHKGGQLCYDLPAPWGNGEIISPCYDSDYFGYMVDGGGALLDNTFQTIWDRDFAILKEMGVNTVRLYDTNPQFRDHKPFLDACQANGIKVIYPLWFNTENMNPNWPVENSDLTGPEDWRLPFMVGIRKQIAEVGRHPAILCFVAGNEIHAVPALSSQQFIIDRIKMAMSYVKANSSIPVTTCPNDFGNNTNSWQWYLNTFTDADLVMVNSGYRGDACTAANSYAELWNILESVVVPSGKAFLLGEVGVHDPDEPGYKRRHFNCFLQSADQNRGRTNLMGVVYFEYMDEPDKPANQKEMGVVKPSLSTSSVSKRKADNIVKKTSSYTGLGTARWEMFRPAGSGDREEASYNYHELNW